MADDLERLKSSWANYPKFIDHLIKAQIEAERLRALSAIYRLQEIKLGIVGVGGMTAPSLTKADFSDLKNQVKKSAQSISRIIFATGAKGIGPYEELPGELKRNFSVFRYTYRNDDLKKLAKASQQTTQAENDIVNLYSSENVYSDTIDSSTGFDRLHAGELSGQTDSERASVKLTAIPRFENSMLIGPNGEKLLQFNHWVPLPDSISTIDPEVQKNIWSVSNPYTLSAGIEKLKSSGNTGVFLFKIRHLASEQEEFFPAFIQNISETITPTWNSVGFINRSEDLYVYEKASRSFALGFLLFADKHESEEKDIPEKFTVYTTNGAATLDVIGKDALWRKIRFLQSLAYPTYSEDGTYKRAPFGRFWMGNLIQGVTFVMDGLTLNYEPLVWNLNSDEVRPMIVNVTMTIKILHNSPPSSVTDFYGVFYNA